MFDYLVTIVLESLIRLSINQSIVQNWERQRQYQTWDRRDQSCVRWGHKSEGKRCFRLSELFPGSISSRSFFACKCFSGSWKETWPCFHPESGFPIYLFHMAPFTFDEHIFALSYDLHDLHSISFRGEHECSLMRVEAADVASALDKLSYEKVSGRFDFLLFFVFKVNVKLWRKKTPPLRLLFLDEQYLI